MLLSKEKILQWSEIGTPAKTSGVYFLIKDGEIIYIGSSKNCFNRIKTHKYNKVDFDSFCIVGVALCKEERDYLETEYIREFTPDKNYANNPKKGIQNEAPAELQGIMRECPACNGSGNISKNDLKDYKVKTAKKLDADGYSLREIQKIMGYKSHGSIQQLLT